MIMCAIGEVDPEGHFWMLFFSPKRGKTGTWYVIDTCYHTDTSSIEYRVPFRFNEKRYKKIWYMFNEDYILKQRR